jgi:tetratricopeptide (TPR) repeat protein
MTYRTLLSLACFSILLTSIGLGHALAQAEDDAETGHAHFERGVEYVQDGDLKAAMVEFKRAYAASPNYRVLYNLGQVSNELSEYTDAQSYFRRYLADGASEIEPARKREVDAMLSKLSSRVANLMLSSNIAGAELFVDDVPVGRTPLSEPVRVSAGTRTIAAAVSGRPRVSQIVEAAGGDTISIKLDFPPIAVAELPPGAPSASERKADTGGPSPVLWLGIGTGALGVATGIMAYLAASDASDYHDAVHRKTTARELNELDDRATSKALVTDILLGATVAAAAVTLVVAITGKSEKERLADHKNAASAHLAVGAGAVGLTGTF